MCEDRATAAGARRRTNLTDATSQFTALTRGFGYDTASRLNAVTGGGQSCSYGYANNGLLASRSMSGGQNPSTSVTITRDGLGRVSGRVTKTATAVAAFEASQFINAVLATKVTYQETGVVALTITGTPFTFYAPSYYDLSPVAQQVVDFHENIHQNQPIWYQLVSDKTRELPAYKDTLDKIEEILKQSPDLDDKTRRDLEDLKETATKEIKKLDPRSTPSPTGKKGS